MLSLKSFVCHCESDNYISWLKYFPTTWHYIQLKDWWDRATGAKMGLEKRNYRVHKCGFRVGHQHKHIGIQAKLVNPGVQLCCDVCPRASECKRGQEVKQQCSKLQQLHKAELSRESSMRERFIEHSVNFRKQDAVKAGNYVLFLVNRTQWMVLVKTDQISHFSQQTKTSGNTSVYCTQISSSSKRVQLEDYVATENLNTDKPNYTRDKRGLGIMSTYFINRVFTFTSQIQTSDRSTRSPFYTSSTTSHGHLLIF